MNDQRFEIIKLHKAWADGHTLVWLVIVIALLVGMFFILQQIGIAEGERTSAFVLLAVILLVSAVWQAAGMAVARIHMIIRGIDLGLNAEPGRKD